MHVVHRVCVNRLPKLLRAYLKLSELADHEVSASNPNTRMAHAPPREKISKKKMSPLIGIDMQKLGREEFAKKDIVAIRVEEDLRRTRKTHLRKCVLHSIYEGKHNKSMIIPPDNAYTPSWQEFVRGNRNNLNLRWG